MARKKGGLGQAAAVEVKEDLLDSVFGAPKAAPKPEADIVALDARNARGLADGHASCPSGRTPPPAPQAAAGKGKEAPKGKENRVGKYFLIDRDLAKAMKLFAVQNDMKEIAVIEASLRAFLGKHEE